MFRSRRSAGGQGILWAILAVSLVVGPGLAQSPADSSASAPWEDEIRRFEEQDRLHAPKPSSVLFLGSSSIRLWDTLAEDFPRMQVLNRGFGGSEIRDATRYVSRIVTPYRPRLIVFYSGDNDLASGRTPEQVAADFEEFVARVRRDLPQIRIAFVSIKPSPARKQLLDVQRKANEAIRKSIEGKPNLVYVDVATPMLTAEGKTRPELFLEDGLRMNHDGYLLWRDRITKLLR